MTAIMPRMENVGLLVLTKTLKPLKLTYYNLAQAQEMLTEQKQTQERNEALAKTSETNKQLHKMLKGKRELKRLP